MEPLFALRVKSISPPMLQNLEESLVFPIALFLKIISPESAVNVNFGGVEDPFFSPKIAAPEGAVLTFAEERLAVEGAEILSENKIVEVAVIEEVVLLDWEDFKWIALPFSLAVFPENTALPLRLNCPQNR